MNGSSKHTLYGVIFIAVCVMIAGIVYAVIRSPAPTEVIENTSSADMRVDLETATPTPDGTDVTKAESAAPLPDPDADNDANLGYCHSGESSWSKTLSSDSIQTDQRGRLLKLTLLGGSSSDSGSGPITWNSRPHDVYIFCSTAFPAVMMQDSGKWQVDVLDFVDGIPGVLESAASLYGDACHAGDSGFPDNAEQLGYSSIPDEQEEVQITQPTDIFDRVG